MLNKLQKKTLAPAQIIAYLFTLTVGVIIILTTLQFYIDIRPLIYKESSVLDKNAVVMSKNISLFKSINKEGIYFSDNEIEKLKENEFIKDIARFNTAAFEITAYLDIPGSNQSFYTDLFFESIPDEYLDIQPEDWEWDPESDFIPVIVPESYLSLYNFGFAESQGLPVISANTITMIGFKIMLNGNYKRKTYNSRIVGLSHKVNTILVPDEFLSWANKEYSKGNPEKASRLLVEFTNASDDRIPAFLKENAYSVNKEELAYGKMVFIVQTALVFAGFIAAIIILLSSGFILLSINLIIQRNKELILNLYNIGYSAARIARFYQVVVSVITAVSVLASMLVCQLLRPLYMDRFNNMLTESTPNRIWLAGTILFLLLFLSYNYLVIRNIKKITG